MNKLHERLWKKANKVIAGGNMLLSKKPERFLKKYFPVYYKKSKGCKIYTIDNKVFLDLSLMSVGTCILGYSHEKVNNKVKDAINNGNISTLNSTKDIILAKMLIKMNPWAGSVKLMRSGGETLSAAIRIARAYTGNQKILFCGYHGWHDWYLSSNLQNKKNLDKDLMKGLNIGGVPKALKNTSYPFEINNYEKFKKLIKMNDIAAVVMEVERNIKPEKKFLLMIKNYCKKNNKVLIFDECTSGFRECYGGIYKKYGINPNMVMYGKSLGNGYPITALVGENKVMSAIKNTFISSTFWTETIGPTAAIETLKNMKLNKSWQKISKIGDQIKINLLKIAKKNNLQIEISGLRSIPKINFINKNNEKYKNFICFEMLKEGILFKDTIYVSLAHNKKILNKFYNVLNKVFIKISNNKIKKNIYSIKDFRRLN